MYKTTKRKTTKNKMKLLVQLLLVAIIVVNGMGNSIPVQAFAPTLKVGYIDYNGFIEENNGEYTGYGVEYLNKIAEYTGWKYEYVYDSWESCLAKLEKGEIDLLCTAQYTEERAKSYAYTKLPLGYESTIFYVPTDSELYYNDFAAMDGKKVGLLTASFQTQEFIQFAEERRMTYEPVYFKTETEIMEALKKGEVEVAAVGSLAHHDDVRVVGKYGAEPFYCIAQKGKEKLVGTIDSALEKIKNDSPSFETDLEKKYYGDSKMSSLPLFTKEEHDFISQADVIQVELMKDYTPLSYVKDEEGSGIFARYLDLIAEKSGLQFQIKTDLTPEEIIDNTRNMTENNAVVLRSQRSIAYAGLDEGMIASNVVMNLDMTYVKRQKDAQMIGRTDYVYALTKEMRFMEEILRFEKPNCEVYYYDTARECMEAVLNWDADVAVQYNYVVTYLMQKPIFAERLIASPGLELENGMCIVASAENQILISILNKTINFISSEERDGIVTEELLMNPYENNVNDMFYQYRYVIIVLIVVLVLTAIVYMIILQRMTRLKFEKREYEFLQVKILEDELTGVYNRNAFFEKAREMIDRHEEIMYIVMMDIINFKVVNDLYGVENGDRLLCHIADELKKMGEDKEFIVARFTGDHFYMCMTKQAFDTIEFPTRLKTFLEDMDIKVNYGIFIVDEQRNIPVNNMCDRASLAVHNNERKSSEHFHYYSESERKKILHAQEMENDMEKALLGHQFCIHVQPKYDIYKEQIIGGEALVRWQHPKKGMISPGLFIDVFEKNGSILQLDYYVWEETCKLLAQLKGEGLTGFPISINVSRAHFYGNDLQEKLEGLVYKYQLDPKDLELEITETICAEDPDIIYKKVENLRQAGFKVAMDDFGSGYSSLNMLKEMPLDILKMDLKFLDGGEDIEKSHNILRTLITLAHSLQLRVIVEGVETEDQVRFLRNTGNAYVQGYYYSKPVDIVTYATMLRKEREA